MGYGGRASVRSLQKRGGRLQGMVELFAVLERLQTVGEDVTGELALVGEGGAAVHAGVQSG